MAAKKNLISHVPSDLRTHRTEVAKEIGRRIRAARKQRGLTTEALAHAALVQRSRLSAWENGKGIPDAINLMCLASALKVSIDELLIGTQPTAGRHSALGKPALPSAAYDEKGADPRSPDAADLFETRVLNAIAAQAAACQAASNSLRLEIRRLVAALDEHTDDPPRSKRIRR